MSSLPARDQGAGTISGHFADAATARSAIENLQRRGIDGGAISLHGDSIDRAADREDTAVRDRASVRFVSLRVFAGAVAGTIAGALIGWLIATVADRGGSQPGTFALIGALAFGVVTAIAVGVRTLMLNDDWQLTFEPQAGEVIVAVRDVPADAAASVRDALQQHGAQEVRTDGVRRAS
jgi:hypothetical protein